MEQEEMQKGSIFEQPKPEKRRMVISADNWLKTGFFVSSALAISALALAGYLYLNQPRIVSFDVKETTKTFLIQVGQLKVSEEEKARIVKRYEQTLNRVIEDYQKNENTTILVSNAVVSKVDDKTDEIKRRVAQQMKSK